MRISVSVWEDKVSPVLDTAAKLLIVDNENERESRFEAYLPEQDMSQRYMFIRSLDIEVLICGAVSRHLSRMIEASGIKIISGISGPAEDVLKAYIQGNLFEERFLMPGRKVDRMD